MSIYKEEDLTNAIIDFHGENLFLSNFYDIQVEYEDFKYKNTEAAYQAAKYPHRTHKSGFTGLHAGAAKKLDRAFRKEGIEIVKYWDTYRLKVMLDLLLQKFNPNGTRAQVACWQLLDATGDKLLVEGNHWGDRYWGMTVNTDGFLEGENRLGKLLMTIRHFYRLKEEKEKIGS